MSAAVQGLDGEYWGINDGPRSRKSTLTLELETALAPVKEKRIRKKRAPLSEEKKRAIAARMKQKMEIRKAHAIILQERDARAKKKRMEYLMAKDTVQRDGIEIYNNVYVGGKLSAMNYDMLKERNVTGILNATTEVRLYYEGEFDYKRISVNDHHEEQLIDHFEDAIRFIISHIENGVHVHCQMGQSRSCTLLVAFGMKSNGWDLRTTMTHLKQQHACIGINDGFKRQLMEYEKSLYGENSMDFFRKRNLQTTSSQISNDLSSSLVSAAFSNSGTVTQTEIMPQNSVVHSLIIPSSLPLSLLSKPTVNEAQDVCTKQVFPSADTSTPIVENVTVVNSMTNISVDVDMEDTEEVTSNSGSTSLQNADAVELLPSEDSTKKIEITPTDTNMFPQVPTSAPNYNDAINSQNESEAMDISTIPETEDVVSVSPTIPSKCVPRELSDHFDGPFWTTPSKRRTRGSLNCLN